MATREQQSVSNVSDTYDTLGPQLFNVIIVIIITVRVITISSSLRLLIRCLVLKTVDLLEKVLYAFNLQNWEWVKVINDTCDR